MPTGIVWTDADLEALMTAYATGASSVTLADGRSISYRSAADLWTAIQRIRRALGYDAPLRPTVCVYERGSK